MVGRTASTYTLYLSGRDINKIAKLFRPKAIEQDIMEVRIRVVHDQDQFGWSGIKLTFDRDEYTVTIRHND